MMTATGFPLLISVTERPDFSSSPMIDVRFCLAREKGIRFSDTVLMYISFVQTAGVEMQELIPHFASLRVNEWLPAVSTFKATP
jgi:hypothetical protein